MARFPAHLWRKERLALLKEATQGCELLVAVGDRLEKTRKFMSDEARIEYPGPYCGTSIDNIKRLLGDIDVLSCKLVLRAKGLTQEAEEFGEDEDTVWN